MGGWEEDLIFCIYLFIYLYFVLVFVLCSKGNIVPGTELHTIKFCITHGYKMFSFDTFWCFTDSYKTIAANLVSCVCPQVSVWTAGVTGCV